MKKRSFLLAVVLVISMMLTGTCSLAVSADDGDFVVESGIIMKYTGAGGQVILPQNATEIADGVFKGRTDITCVVVSDGAVKKIGAHAFEGCTSLTGFDFGRVDEIGESAFAGCTVLGSVSCRAKKIGKDAFKGCASLKKFTLYAYSNFEISYHAVSDCPKLETVKIQPAPKTFYLGEPVGKQIENEAFFICPALKTVKLSSYIQYVGEKAFGYGSDENGAEQKVTDCRILGSKDSAGEKYAVDNGFEFVDLDALGRGDVNGDKKITTADALMALQAAVGKIQLDEVQQKAADINVNGKIESIDALCILHAAMDGYIDLW